MRAARSSTGPKRARRRVSEPRKRPAAKLRRARVASREELLALPGLQLIATRTRTGGKYIKTIIDDLCRIEDGDRTVGYLTVSWAEDGRPICYMHYYTAEEARMAYEQGHAGFGPDDHLFPFIDYRAKYGGPR